MVGPAGPVGRRGTAAETSSDVLLYQRLVLMATHASISGMGAVCAELPRPDCMPCDILRGALFFLLSRCDDLQLRGGILTFKDAGGVRA